MQRGTNKSVWKELVLVTVVGILFSRFSLGSVLMTIPLLIVVPNVKNLWQALLAFAVMLAGTVTWTVVDSLEVIKAGYGSVLAITLFLPVCAIGGATAWSIVSRKSRAGLRKFFYACAPAVVLGLALAVWFSSDYATATKEILRNSLLYAFPSDTLGVNIESIVDLALSFLNVSFVPMGMAVVAVPVLISDLIMYRYDEAWQYDFACMKLPDPFVGFFFGFWAVALASSLVSAIPMVVYCVCWNVALALTVLYAVQGLSILVALFRRRTAFMSVGRVVSFVLLLCFIPGVNLICFVGLPILGLLETWFRFR